MKAHAKKIEPVTLAQFVREALEDRDWNVEKTVNFLVTKVLNDKALLTGFLREIVQEAMTQRVRDSHRHHRGSIVYHATKDTKGSVVALAAGISASLLDFPLEGGMLLRTASRADVSAAAQRYRTSERTAGHRARWLELIAQSVPQDKTVGDVLTDDRALELWEQTNE